MTIETDLEVLAHVTDDIAAQVKRLADKTAEAVSTTTEGFMAHNERLERLEREVARLHDRITDLGRHVFTDIEEDET